MARHREFQGKGGTRRWMLAALLSLGVGAAAGCKDLLDVTIPGDVAETALTDISLASTLASSVQGDFECMFGNYALSVGVWTHDLVDSSTWATTGAWNTRRTPGGGGTCSTSLNRGGGTFGPYLQLHIARVQATNAFEIISGHPDNLANKQRMLATVKAYEGYTLVLLGEGWCDVHIDGVASSKADAFNKAVEAFTAAMGNAAAPANILNMARVGRARALVNLGRPADAKPFAEAVPAGFVYNATYDATPTRRNNLVAGYNHFNVHVSVGPYYRGLMVDGVLDPRTRSVQAPATQPSNDSVTPLWLNQLFTALNTPIPIATYREAQLIVAEAELAANNAGAATAAINRVRATFTGIPEYGGGTVAEVRTQLIEERRRTLFLQGHRLGDMLRFEQAFDSGLDHKGRAIAPNTCWPNPEFL